MCAFVCERVCNPIADQGAILVCLPIDGIVHWLVEWQPLARVRIHTHTHIKTSRGGFVRPVRCSHTIAHTSRFRPNSKRQFPSVPKNTPKGLSWQNSPTQPILPNRRKSIYPSNSTRGQIIYMSTGMSIPLAEICARAPAAPNNNPQSDTDKVRGKKSRRRACLCTRDPLIKKCCSF